MSEWQETEVGRIPSDWAIERADLFCEKVTDGTHDSPKQCSKGYPLVTSKHIKGTSINFNDTYLISKNDYNQINLRSKVDQWDVIISMIGEYCGFVFIEENKKIEYAIKNVGLFKTGNEAEGRWLFYYLNSSLGSHQLRLRRSGTSQPYLSLGSLRELPIVYPTKPEEKQSIVNILSNLDLKIDNLQKQNKILEKIAQLLFKQWFVDFNFSDKNGLPYKNYGGEMVESELGKIPKGWRFRMLREISEKISKGTTPRKNDVEGLLKEIPFLKVKDITNGGLIKLESLENIPKKTHNNALNRSKLETNDILFSIAGTIGRVAIVSKVLDNSNCNQAIAFIRLSSKYNFLEYVHQWIKSTSVQFEIKSNIVQGVQANVSLTVLGNLQIIIPVEYIMIKWNNFIKPIYQKLDNNITQIQALTKARDTLLPKLMSGQIRIPD